MKINKNDFIQVSGNREQLQEYLGQECVVDAFVTNTIGYTGGKRLINEVILDNLYIPHLWMKTENIGKLNHGYQKLKVKVTKYKDVYTGDNKYGLKYIGKRGKKFIDYSLRKPKWMK